MHGLALVFTGLVFCSDPIELAGDVVEIQTRQLAMPLRFDPDRQDKIERVRLFVSEGRGKAWNHKKDYKATDEQVTFAAPRDGLYWFALQTVFKDGKCEPATQDDLVPAQKVYVNSERKVLKVQKSYEELEREVEALRKTVEQLQKRIAELESDPKRR
jgi:hypothetical protein